MSNEKFKEENKDNERLTIEAIREVKGFEDIGKKEAERLSKFIYKFSSIIFDYEFTK